MTKITDIPAIRFKGFSDTWEQRKVREVTDRYDNLRIPVAASLRVAGTTPYYGANGIQDYVDGYTHDGEFILVAEDGANDLKNYPVKCVKGRIWVNNHAHVLQGKYDCADNQFLAYAISQADIESLLVGGGRAKLNAETLMGIDLLLPNKAEQIRIGKYLAQLDNLITLHQREFAFLCKEKSKKFRYIKNAWEQRKLSDIAVLTSSKRVHAEDYVETGVPFYRGKEISELKEHKPISEVLYITEYKYNEISSMYGSPKEGDLLITAVGTLGNTWVIDQTPFYFKDGNLIWFKDIKCNPKYLDYAMSTADGQKKILASAIGSNQKALTMVKLNELEFMFPGKAEQDKIAEYFSYLDNLITLHQRKPVVVNSSSTMNALPNQHLYFQVLE